MHGVKPGNIVGAIANEADLDSKYIGRIDIHEDHSILDLPEGMPKPLLMHLKKVRVAGQLLRLQRVDEFVKNDSKPHDARPAGFKPGGPKPGNFKPRREEFRSGKGDHKRAHSGKAGPGKAAPGKSGPGKPGAKKPRQ
jgi:ATP-dependent RNA helicase DeaD